MFFFFFFFQKFPGTFKALCLLLLSEQIRYPPSANLSQVQTLSQNCLHTAFWYASTTSYIFDRQSRILLDHNLYSSDLNLGNRGFTPSRTGINLNRKFPSFKSFNPPKNCAHWNGLRSIYTTQFIKYMLWTYNPCDRGIGALTQNAEFHKTLIDSPRLRETSYFRNYIFSSSIPCRL